MKRSGYALLLLAALGLGIGGGSTGSLLWPAVVLHAVLTLLLARAWFAGVTMERVKQ